MVNTEYKNVYTAKREYDDNSVGYKLRTESGEYIGTLSDINNNRSNNGEQIFTYTKTENGRRAVPLDTPLNERVKAKKLHCNKEKNEI